GLASNEHLQIIAASQEGIIQLLTVHNSDDAKSTSISKIKENTWPDDVKSIIFPTPKMIMYSTQKKRKHQTKLMYIFDILDNKNNESLKSIPFSCSTIHEQISLDSSNNIAAAHWTKNPHSSE